MISRSTLLHLRIPFSYYLLPVFLFALATSPNFEPLRVVFVFVILHVFVYPASNGYNSYFDKDEKSIGGLEKPPPVDRSLYFTSLLFDAVAVVLGLFAVNVLFALMVFTYGMVSKAYSHPLIRLKKFPVTGWLVAGFFQGFFTFLMCYAGINNFGVETFTNVRVLIPAMLTSVMLWGNYPMTQIYQHEEDRRHGDRTLSRVLGIRGTFLFVQVVFLFAAAGFVEYFRTLYTVYYAYAFLAALAPVVVYFSIWMVRAWHDPSRADFKSTMRLNFISATCLNGFFVFLWLSSTHVGQYLRG